MNLLVTILNASGGAAVQNMSKSLGLGEAQTQSALSQLLTVVARAIGNNSSSSDGLSLLLGALEKGNYQRYLNHPELLVQTDTVNDGNNILGHLFGSKDVSRNLAPFVSEHRCQCGYSQKNIANGGFGGHGCLQPKDSWFWHVGCSSLDQLLGLRGIGVLFGF